MHIARGIVATLIVSFSLIGPGLPIARAQSTDAGSQPGPTTDATVNDRVDSLLADFHVTDFRIDSVSVRVDYISNGQPFVAFVSPRTIDALLVAYEPGPPKLEQAFPPTRHVPVLIGDSIRVDFVRNGSALSVSIPQRALAGVIAVQMVDARSTIPAATAMDAADLPVVNRFPGADFLFAVEEASTSYLNLENGNHLRIPAPIHYIAASNYDKRFGNQLGRSSVFAEWGEGLVNIALNFGVSVSRLVVGALIVLAILIAALLLWSRKRRLRAERFSQQLMDAREQERSRLAADLHDGPVQELIVALRDLNSMREESTSPELSATVQSLADLKRSLRNTCNDLSPPVLDHFGLRAAIGMLAETFAERNPSIAINVDVDDAAAAPVPKEIAVTLYRIVQECLTNIDRHSEATRASITLKKRTRGVELVVHDNGRGFEVDHSAELAGSGHFGLVFAERRAEVVGAKLTVNSAANDGTTVRVTAPIRMRRRTFRRVAAAGETPHPA